MPDGPSSFVTYELVEDVARIGLNRTAKRNALSADLLQALHGAVARAGGEARAGLLFGHGGNFSAGLDLAELAERIEAGPVSAEKRWPSPWHVTFDLVARGPIPFVAALHGATIGGGLELAAAAHIRVADRTTVLGLPEGQRGIFVGGGGTVRLQRIIGYAAMADMMLTGRLLTAEEGRDAGLVQYLVDPDQAIDKAFELARKIAANTPLTNWQITNLLPRINDLSHDDGLFVEALNAAVARPPESLDRLRAFLDKKADRLVGPPGNG